MKRRMLLVSTLCLAFGPGCARRSTAPADPAAAQDKLDYELEQGAAVYRYYCQTCHGETGAGDGFNAYNLDPRPADLSTAAFQKSKTDADLTEAVRRGGVGVGLSPLMPPWGHTLSSRQIHDVVRYVRSLAKKTPPASGS